MIVLSVTTALQLTTYMSSCWLENWDTAAPGTGTGNCRPLPAVGAGVGAVHTPAALQVPPQHPTKLGLDALQAVFRAVQPATVGAAVMGAVGCGVAVGAAVEGTGVGGELAGDAPAGESATAGSMSTAWPLPLLRARAPAAMSVDWCGVCAK
jgi:hypothetical protein